MIKVEIQIDEINYENLVVKLIPARWIHPLAKVGLHLLPSKEKIMFHIFSKNKELLIDKINTYFEAEKLYLNVREAELNQVRKGMQNILLLALILDDINYKQMIETILPMIIENLSKKEDKQGELTRCLAGMGTTPLIMTTAALDAISQRAKDEIFSAIVNIYQEDIVKAINCMLAKKDITSEILSLHVEGLSS